MALVNGITFQKAYVDQPREFVAAGAYRGELKVMDDEYEAVALPDGDDIRVGRLTKGNVIHYESIIFHDAMGASTTLALKLRDRTDAATETVLYAAEDSSSAGNVGGTGGITSVFPFTLLEDAEVIVALVGADATGTIKTEIRYADN